MLEIRNVSKRYRLSNYRRQRFPALQGVSLHVDSGTATAIVGESGSGKSTLCRLVLGLERPDDGSVRWQGKDVRSYRRKDLYRQIQPVFQDNLNSLDPRWTVERSIAEPLRNDRWNDREAAREVERLLDLMELPKPEVLVVDEPELGLHPAAIVELAGMVRIAAQNSQVLLATQSPRLVDEFSPEQLLIVEFDEKERCSLFSRLNAEALQEWLERYSLSDLWEKNVLGAQP